MLFLRNWITYEEKVSSGLSEKRNYIWEYAFHLALKNAYWEQNYLNSIPGK